jgi:ribosomal 30S subunit maturation factor RimM
MKSAETVYYNGQYINKAHFRVHVYGLNGESKLVNSFDEFERDITSGQWFESKESMEAVKSMKPAPRSRAKPKVAAVKEEVVAEEVEAFEVVNGEEVRIEDVPNHTGA